MADFLHYINGSGIKISAVATSDGFKSQSQVFKTESLVGASGLNSTYDERFHQPYENADTLNHRSGHYYLDRANHSGNINSSLYVSGLGYSVSSGVDYNNSYRSGTYIVNWAQANLQTITLSGATTLVFSGAMNGSRLQLLVNQDSVGSRAITWPSTVKWSTGTQPTLTTTQSGVDILAFYTNNSLYYGSSALDFR